VLCPARENPSRAELSRPSKSGSRDTLEKSQRKIHVARSREQLFGDSRRDTQSPFSAKEKKKNSKDSRDEPNPKGKEKADSDTTPEGSPSRSTKKKKKKDSEKQTARYCISRAEFDALQSAQDTPRHAMGRQKSPDRQPSHNSRKKARAKVADEEDTASPTAHRSAWSASPETSAHIPSNAPSTMDTLNSVTTPDCVHDRVLFQGQRHYLVSWYNLPDRENLWITVKAAPVAQTIIQAYENEQKGRPRTVDELPSTLVPYTVRQCYADDEDVYIVIKYQNGNERVLVPETLNSKKDLEAAVKVAHGAGLRALKRAAKKLTW
jgi:hypothetical protein